MLMLAQRDLGLEQQQEQQQNLAAPAVAAAAPVITSVPISASG